MNANQITKEQVLDALQTHKTISNATKALGIKHPEMMKLMKRYGITANHTKKKETPESNEEAKELDDVAKAQKWSKAKFVGIHVFFFLALGIFIGNAIIAFLNGSIHGGLGWVCTTLITGCFFFEMKVAAKIITTYKAVVAQYKTILDGDQSIFAHFKERVNMIIESRPSIRKKYLLEMEEELTKLTEQDCNETK